MTYGHQIVKMQFGSHVYGTNLPTSDLDFKAVHIPPAADILLGCARETINVKTKANDAEKNCPDDIDFESFSLHKFMKLLLDGQTIPLSMIFTPDKWVIDASDEWQEIKNMKEHWLHSGVSAFAGYCRQQANKYGIKGSRIASARATILFLDNLIENHGHLARLKEHWGAVEDFVASGVEHVAVLDETMSGDRPVKMLEVCSRKMQEHCTLKEAHSVYKRMLDEYGKRALAAESNQGVDWKALMHATRVCNEAAELLLHRTITYPRPESDLLLKIRKGELPYKVVADMLEERMDNLEKCQRLSRLPREPDHGRAKELVYQRYRNTILTA